MAQYIPPRHPDDPPQCEAVQLFLDAVARQTDAFRDLRSRILPLCSLEPHRLPLEEFDAWFAKWHFAEASEELREMIQSRAIEVLYSWQKNPAEAEALKVDAGWWAVQPEHRFDMVNDRQLALTMPGYNYLRESFEDYERQRKANFQKVLDAERELWEKAAEQYSMREKSRRERKYDPDLVWDWLALWLVDGKSDGYIARKAKQPKSTVKLALHRAQQSLKW